MKTLLIKLFLFISICCSMSFTELGNRGLAVVLVDMQYGYYEVANTEGSKGLNSLVKKQQELLSWAKEKKIPVVVFESIGYGKTDKRLMKALEGHQYKIIKKNDDDGFLSDNGYQAVEALNNWEVDTVIMAGINGANCILQTTYGAIDEGFSVITSGEIVGNLNISPPVYPDTTWVDELTYHAENFVVFEKLEDIIK